MQTINYTATTSFEAPPEGPRERTSLVVDAESLAYRAYYAFTRDNYIKKTQAGYYNGCFWGFFMWLGKRYLTYFPEQMYVCWGDIRQNLIRKELLSSYKGQREAKVLPAFQEQIRDIKLALHAMGFHQYFSEGYEGDDTVATIVKREELRGYTKVVVISNDKDMIQLVSDKTDVLQITLGNSGEDKIYSDRNQVIEKFGIPVWLLTDYLILLGDKSDNISGIQGIGPKTAVKLLENFGPIDNWIHRIDELDISGAVKKLLKDGKLRIDVNKRLVRLTYDAPLTPIEIYSENITADSLFDIYEVQQIRPHQFLFEN